MEINAVAHFRLENNSGKTQMMSVGQPLEGYDGKTLFNLKPSDRESIVTIELVKSDWVLQYILPKFGINYPNCWIGKELKKEIFYPDFVEERPGDIDLLIGNFKDDNNTFCFENLIAFEIKTRLVSSLNELKAPSQEGTTQSNNAVKLGFDKTFLFHIFIREPVEPPSDHSPLWNNLININDFSWHVRRGMGKMKKNLENDLFGYAWLGWAQSFGDTWENSGNIQFDIVKEPAQSPWKHRSEFESNRKKLIEKLSTHLSQKRPNGKFPFIF